MSDTRERWETLFERLYAEAQAAKSAHDVVLQMEDAYSVLGEDERRSVDALLSEWMLSDEERKRFIAVALTRQHRIMSVLPAAETLVRRLAGAKTPSAPFEREKVERLINELRA